jgi:hypothetical protein
LAQITGESQTFPTVIEPTQRSAIDSAAIALRPVRRSG